MKQKILVIDEKIRSMIEQDSNDTFLKNAARFSYKHTVVFTLLLVSACPILLYFSGYVFSLTFYYIGLQ